ncbi:hypothetical protein DRW41_05365 [Neobacillus piezotolerans]|uniref:Type I restriction modification DNA specificity domain-containing protein n=1 Tax=Neobacillus piezotolerans TaxID=2259171 RepID=A0A3D8GS32_9BACI|nr:restriction endonuclease subunit S [Neobacillus piezotolerans]RDU37283.1 hypothetical protein DRW41_05365 [Neobacillus piezotolerans]
MTALLDHFHEAITTPDDVEKLKKLILQHAMQGKLVEQDPNDEPASKLFKRIEKEKQKLIKEKILKNSKPLPSIEESDIPYQLPEGWIWVRLGDIGITQTGATPSTSKPEYFGGEYPFITPADISENGIDYYQRSLSKVGIEYGRIVSENSVLMVCIGGSIGKCYYTDRLCSCNQQINTITGLCSISGKFLYYFMSSSYFYKSVIENATGSATPIINKNKWESIAFPLPPLEEQNRIVKKIEELFKQSDELLSKLIKMQAKSVLLNKIIFTKLQDHSNYERMKDLRFAIENMEHLCNDKDSINQLRKTILSLAVQGKLEVQNVNEEPASVLVEKIKQEKERMISEKIIKKEKPLQPITAEEVPFLLPNGWEWVRLGEITMKLGAGKTPLGGEKNYVQEGIKFIRSQNVWNSGLLLDGVAHITAETNESMKGSIVQAKDILLNITGASIGRSSLVPDDFDIANVNQHVAIIRLVDDSIRHYIHTCIISPYFQNEVMRVQVGASREGLSMTKLAKFIIPLPPVEEQVRIMDKVQSLFCLIDQYENKIVLKEKSTKTLSDSLIESILM